MVRSQSTHQKALCQTLLSSAAESLRPCGSPFLSSRNETIRWHDAPDPQNREARSLHRKPTLEEVKQMILKHAALLVQEKGVYTGMREMRKHVAWYTTGYPHSAKLRARVNEITSLEELTGLLEQL